MTEKQIAAAVLGLDWCLFLACIILARGPGPKGKKSAFETTALVMIVPMIFASFAMILSAVPAQVFAFNPGLIPTEEERWISVLLPLLAPIVFPGLPLIWGLRHRTVSLTAISLPRREGARPRIGHLSDLHLTAGRTIEGNLSTEQTYRSAAQAVSWAMSKSDLVFVTGDITDTGDTAEWKRFRELLLGLPAVDRERLILIPGNHDLSLTLSLAEPAYDMDHEDRCKNFALNVLQDCPDRWLMWHDRTLLSVRSVLTEASAYIDAYREHPPSLGYSVSNLGVVYPSNLKFPDELLSAARDHLVWPKEGLLFKDLLTRVYPIVFYQDKSMLVVGLNSCCAPAMSIFSGAFGYLDPNQLDRLIEILESCAGRCLVLLLHHHVGMTPELKKILAKLKSPIATKGLQLRNARLLLDLLTKYGSPIVIFHGHQHIGYRAGLGRVRIVSAPSVAYGDEVFRGAPNCVVYGFDDAGELSITEELNLRA